MVYSPWGRKESNVQLSTRGTCVVFSFNGSFTPELCAIKSFSWITWYRKLQVRCNLLG